MGSQQGPALPPCGFRSALRQSEPGAELIEKLSAEQRGALWWPHMTVTQLVCLVDHFFILRSLHNG